MTLIAATAVVGAVLMALYTFFLVTPMYKATATIYVVSRDDSVLNFSDLQVGSELTSDYIKVFEMWEVHEKVISNLDLDYTYTDMASMLSVTNTSDTRMLDITVTNPDPEEAAAIANEYADVGAKYISEKMKTDEPTLMSSARVPENPFSPNKAKNILLGFVVGFVLACAVVVVRTMLDDTYKSADDIRKYTGHGRAGIDPLADAGEQPKEKSEFKRRTKRFAKDVRRRVGGRFWEERMKQLKITKFPALDYAGNEAFNTLSTNLSFAGAKMSKNHDHQLPCFRGQKLSVHEPDAHAGTARHQGGAGGRRPAPQHGQQ